MALVELDPGLLEQVLARHDELAALQHEFSAAVGVFVMEDPGGRKVGLLLLQKSHVLLVGLFLFGDFVVDVGLFLLGEGGEMEVLGLESEEQAVADLGGLEDGRFLLFGECLADEFEEDVGSGWPAFCDLFGHVFEGGLVDLERLDVSL